MNFYPFFMQEKFANIAFNIPVSSHFTYSIPEELRESVLPGLRVLAPFGNKDITGIVLSVSDKTELTKLKNIKKVLDPVPLLNDEMLSFCKWISAYYIAPIGEVVFAAVPKGVNIETRILYSASENIPNSNYTQLQKNIISLLKEKTLSIKQIENKLKSASVRNAVNSLTASGALVQEFVLSTETAKPKFEKYVRFDLLEECT